MAADRVLDAALGHLFARALVAIARADDEIGPDEGLRLQQRLAARVAGRISLDELLLAEPLEPHRLAESVRAAASPFRNAWPLPAELAELLILDGLAVVLAKGYVSEAEARELVRFASALGCSLDLVRALAHQAAPWLGALV